MKPDIDIRNKRQYLIGAAIALVLSAVIAVIPALCGFSLVGNYADFSWFVMIHDLLFYLLIIGPVSDLCLVLPNTKLKIASIRALLLDTDYMIL